MMARTMLLCSINPFACTMKTRFISLGAALIAAFVLASCNTEEAFVPTLDPSTEGTPFEISTILTKTTNDGLSTKWAADDAINLFHAEADSTTYVSDSKFTVDEGLVGNFSGTLNGNLEEGKSYDWYAFYPYTEQIITPANTKGGYAYIGGRSDKAQTQDGNDSKEHLAGSNCPLYGVAKGIASADKPSLAMQQLASVVAVKVTNTLDNDLIVSNVSFTSTEDITGQYYIDFSKETPDYNATTYVSKTANLTVTDGTAITKGSSAVFYIAIKPHKVASGSTLTLSVNGANKTVTLTKDVTFTAGHIKTLAYDYNPKGLALPFEEDFEGASIVATNQEAKLTDFTRFSQFTKIYSESKGELRVGSSKACGSMKTVPIDLSSESTVIISAKTWSGDNTSIKITVNGKEYYSEALSTDYEDYYINLPAVGSYESITITSKNDTKNRFYIDNLKIVSGTITAPKPPVITPASTSFSLEYNDETVHEISVTVTGQEGDVTCGVYDDTEGNTASEWCTAEYKDGVIEFLAESNESTTARTAYIILSASNSDGTTKSVITATQGINQTVITSYTLQFGKNYNSKGISSYTATWSATCNNTTWNIENFNNYNNEWDYVKAGSKSSASIATITTSSALSASISKITITIDAVTSSAVNSIYLQISEENSFTNAEKLTLGSISEGDQTISIVSPKSNCFYKVSFDMKKDKNGTIRISKVVYE